MNTVPRLLYGVNELHVQNQARLLLFLCYILQWFIEIEWAEVKKHIINYIVRKKVGTDGRTIVLKMLAK